MNLKARALSDLLDTPPPADPDSERALLAAVIVDATQLDHVGALVSLDDFHDAQHGDLFEAVAILREAGLPTNDVAVLSPELKRMGVPEAVRTPAFIGKLIGEGIGWNAKYYAHIVKKCAILRRQRDIACELLARVAHPQADPVEINRWLESQVAGVGYQSDEPSKQIADLARELVTGLKATPAEGRGVMTGLRSHDEVAGAWMPGELVILAARPGVGKTSLALQVAIHIAMRGRSVTFLSLEMTGRELASRVLCDKANVDSRRLRSGRLEPSHINALEVASVELGGLPLRIWAPPMATISRIRAVAKRDAAAHGLGLLVVDYIGLVRPDDKTRPRHEQVAQVSAGLKSLAKELAAPVLALSQLNREADGAEPRLCHLRESGAIEQDSDVVLFLHPKDARTAKLIIAKHRHGDTGAISLRWIPDRTRYEDIDTSA
jgi:replicative DNA helicase